MDSSHHSLQVCILEPSLGLLFPFLPHFAIDAMSEDQLDDMDSSITTTREVERLVSPASASTGASAGTGAFSATLDHNNEVIVVANGAPPPEPATHPITTATMENFDGEAFNIDGIQYILKDIKVDYLRKFCFQNGIKLSQPPYKSVRSLTKKIVVEEIKARKGRMMNNEPDPWENSSERETSKPAWVNCYRFSKCCLQQGMSTSSF
jgi:hypothetical protein